METGGEQSPADNRDDALYGLVSGKTDHGEYIRLRNERVEAQMAVAAEQRRLETEQAQSQKQSLGSWVLKLFQR